MTKETNGEVRSLSDGGTVHIGEAATRRFQIIAVVTALRFEIRTGLKITGRGALPIAKKLTGMDTNDRERLITRLEEMRAELETHIKFTQEG